MAKDSRRSGSIKRIFHCMFCLWLAGVLFNAESSETDNFRIRLHQSTTQDFVAEDIAAEIRFGQDVAARLLGLEKLLKNPELTHYVSLIGQSLALNSSRNDIEFHFAILDSDRVNAYSAPGGYIFITKAALLMAQDEAEVAAILAHEIAHITERHVVNELDVFAQDQSQLSGFARFIGASGGTTQVALNQAVDKAISIVYETGYKIRDELQADHIATLLLAQTGYDPLALKRYLLRSEKFGKDNPKHVHTHPAPAERFAKLDSLASTENLLQLNFPTAKVRFRKIVTLDLDSQ